MDVVDPGSTSDVAVRPWTGWKILESWTRIESMGKIKGPRIRGKQYHSFESPNKFLLGLWLNSTSGVRAHAHWLMDPTSRGGRSFLARQKNCMVQWKLVVTWFYPNQSKNQRIHWDQNHVKEIFDLQDRKENCWTFFAAAAQVYGRRIHDSVESVEMISSYEIMVSLKFSNGARICYYVRNVSCYSQVEMVAGC